MEKPTNEDKEEDQTVEEELQSFLSPETEMGYETIIEEWERQPNYTIN